MTKKDTKVEKKADNPSKHEKFKEAFNSFPAHEVTQLMRMNEILKQAINEICDHLLPDENHHAMTLESKVKASIEKINPEHDLAQEGLKQISDALLGVSGSVGLDTKNRIEQSLKSIEGIKQGQIKQERSRVGLEIQLDLVFNMLLDIELANRRNLQQQQQSQLRQVMQGGQGGNKAGNEQ